MTESELLTRSRRAWLSSMRRASMHKISGSPSKFTSLSDSRRLALATTSRALISVTE